MGDASHIKVGRISSPYGIKGMVWVYSDTSPMENIFSYRPWLMRRGGELHSVEVLSWRPQGKGLVARLKGCDDCNAAEALAGVDIYIARDALPTLEAGDYYWSDLEDRRVYATTGELLGRVYGLMETGANDVLVVRSCEGSIDDRERLIPWVLDQVVIQVDLAADRIEVDWDPEF